MLHQILWPNDCVGLCYMNGWLVSNIENIDSHIHQCLHNTWLWSFMQIGSNSPQVWPQCWQRSCDKLLVRMLFNIITSQTIVCYLQDRATHAWDISKRCSASCFALCIFSGQADIWNFFPRYPRWTTPILRISFFLERTSMWLLRYILWGRTLAPMSE